MDELSQTNYGEVIKAKAVLPEQTDDIEEDKRFHKYTPSGELRMTVTNPDLKGRFKLGQVFYVNIDVQDPPAE